jgi:prepilin-type N-terminal cleavage/methylation domain-containing protein
MKYVCLKKLNSSSQGFGLVEMLVALSILSIIMAGLTSFMSTTNKNVSQVQMFSQVDRLLDQLYRSASELRVLEASGTNQWNQGRGLKECVGGEGECVSSEPKGFFLIGGFVGQGASQTATFLAGTPEQPVYYYPDGRICRSSPENCPLSVTITYEGFCSLQDLDKPVHLRSAPRCAKAEAIRLHYMISQTYLPDQERHVAISRFSSGQPGDMILTPREGTALVYPPRSTQQPVSNSLVVEIKREISNAMAVNKLLLVINNDRTKGIQIGPNNPTPFGGAVVDRGNTQEVNNDFKTHCCNRIYIEASTRPPPDSDWMQNLHRDANTRYPADAKYFRILAHRMDPDGMRFIKIGYEDQDTTKDDSYDDLVFSMRVPGNAEFEFLNASNFSRAHGVALPTCEFHTQSCN